MRYLSIRILIALFSCLLICGKAQNVQIQGLCHSWYNDKLVELYSYGDLVTMQEVKESADTIRNGFFFLELETDHTRPVLIRVLNLEATLYVEPGATYTITLPEPDERKMVNPDVLLPLNIGILGTDSTELNVLIFDFQRIYNALLAGEEGRFLSRNLLFRRADSLEKICAQRYKMVNNDYFISYVTYKIASLNTSVSRGEEYLMRRFIVGKPIQYRHFEYMDFFSSCFKGYFKTISARYPGQSIFNILNVRADYGSLKEFLKREKILRSDSIRELVTLLNLWDNYFSVEFDRNAIENLVSQLLLDSEIEYHKKIARTMLAYFGRLQQGSEAPDFSARNRDGRIASLGSLKGRWVYLNFFSSANTNSMKEMLKIVDLKRRYGHKVVFVSVCLDDSLAAYKRVLRENPRFDWAVWYNNDPSFTLTAKQKYFVTGTEAYFLISPKQEIMQNPALAPSEGIEYRFNAIFKMRSRRPGMEGRPDVR